MCRAIEIKSEKSGLQLTTAAERCHRRARSARALGEQSEASRRFITYNSYLDAISESLDVQQELPAFPHTSHAFILILHLGPEVPPFGVMPS